MAESREGLDKDLLLPLVITVPVFIVGDLPPCVFWPWVHLVEQFRSHVRRAPVERRN